MNDHLQILRSTYAELAALAARRYRISMGDVKDRAGRLLPEAPERNDPETGDAERWIWAVSALLDGAYPRGESVEAVPGWNGAASRRLHAELGEYNRDYRSGLASKALHADFWHFCFCICGRTPAEIDRQACEVAIDLWARTRGGAARRVA
jgi:hypothetical protein